MCCWMTGEGRAEDDVTDLPTFYLSIFSDLVRIRNNGGIQKGKETGMQNLNVKMERNRKAVILRGVEGSVRKGGGKEA